MDYEAFAPLTVDFPSISEIGIFRHPSTRGITHRSSEKENVAYQDINSWLRLQSCCDSSFPPKNLQCFGHMFAWKKTACWLLSFLHHLGLFCHILPWFFPHVLNIFPPLAVRTGSSKSKSPLRVISARRKTCNQLQLANSVGTENEEKNAPSFVGDDICLICLYLPHHLPSGVPSFGSILFRIVFLLSSVKQLALASFPWIGSESVPSHSESAWLTK